MVLVTHHIQSSYAGVPLRNLSWSKGIRLKQNVVRFQAIARTNRCILLKDAFPLRPAARHMHEAKGKPLQISSFKGNVQNEEAGEESSKSRLPKSSVKISFIPQDGEETLADSLTADNIAVSSVPESNKTRSGSEAIRLLFEKWLSLLRSETPQEAGDNILKQSHQLDHLQEHKASNAEERGQILKVVLCYFLGLDATITIPLLIFIPLYLAVNVLYGAEVSRELTPLWIIGPLIVALYVKLFRGIIALYVFSFKQTVKVIKNMPHYYSIAYKYIAKGRLKEDIHARFWQPVISIKNLDCKEQLMKMWKALEEWLVEKYLDYVESIWPYYCRTIRFLKRANLL